MTPSPPPPSEPSSDQAGTMAGALTRGALRRRVGVLVFLLSIIVVGVVATLGIPLELFPRGYTGQNLRVFVPWRDAPVQEVLQKITLPLEEEVSTVRGLDGINSFSSKGSAGVFLRFKRGTDMDVAYREVRDRVERARALFPTDADRVYIRKDDASGIPVAVIGMAVDPGLTDAYTLGVFIYDMLHGGLPIRNIKMKLYEESTVVELHNNIKFREDLSMEAQDLILRLLSTDPNNRLLGDTEIKALLYHPWLKKYRLLDHSATAPEPLYIPDLSLPNFDSSFNAQFQPFVSELEGTET